MPAQCFFDAEADDARKPSSDSDWNLVLSGNEVRNYCGSRAEGAFFRSILNDKIKLLIGSILTFTEYPL